MIEGYDGMKAGERVSDMWFKLAERIESFAIQQAVNDPVQAIRDACCAEACFWKATGEADTHDVKDVLAFPPSQPADVVGTPPTRP
jgi:hypothetical protein